MQQPDHPLHRAASQRNRNFRHHRIAPKNREVDRCGSVNSSAERRRRSPLSCPTTDTPSRWRFRPPSPRTFRLGLSASAYSAQRRLRPNRAPHSVQERPYENAVAHASRNHSDRTGDGRCASGSIGGEHGACPVVAGCLALARRGRISRLPKVDGVSHRSIHPRLRPKRTPQRAQPAADRGRGGLRAASARPPGHGARVALRRRTGQTPAIERREPGALLAAPADNQAPWGEAEGAWSGASGSLHFSG
jgi:hypothetical protein